MEIFNMGIPIYKQLEKINQTYDNWSGSIMYKQILVLNGKVRPTAISPEYDIHIVYKPNEMPKVHVLSPKLQIRPEKTSLPHIYSEDNLCLYYKDYDKRQDLLAETIIVWITWWLYYYEIWYQTGKWVAKGTDNHLW